MEQLHATGVHNIIHEAPQEKLFAVPPPPIIQEPQAIANTITEEYQSNTVMLQLLAQIKQIQQQLDARHDNYSHYIDQGRAGTGRYNTQGGDGGCGAQRGNRKYFWTHDSYAHYSTECETRAEGHIETATSKNKQGRSTWT